VSNFRLHNYTIMEEVMEGYLEYRITIYVPELNLVSTRSITREEIVLNPVFFMAIVELEVIEELDDQYCDLILMAG
jgi:hypothetical protein